MTSVASLRPTSLLDNVFPDASTLLCFMAYVGFFVLHGLLVTASRKGGTNYQYDPTIVVLLTESLKLLSSFVLFAAETSSVNNICSELWKARRVYFHYVIPAALYCLYNNLSFVNLANFDPTTYLLLLQFRIVVIGVTFQIIFNRKLSKIQWTSLGILTLGCVIKQCSNPGDAKTIQLSHSSEIFSWDIVFIIIQVLCSSIAGVYNEFLLKDASSEASLMIQNIFMYFNSILCNLLLLGFNGGLDSILATSRWTAVIDEPVVTCIVVNGAAMGLVTSFFLKNLNSILKVHASGVELSLLALFSYFLFGIPIDAYTVLAIALISLSSYLYAKYPVQNKATYSSLC